MKKSLLTKLSFISLCLFVLGSCQDEKMNHLALNSESLRNSNAVSLVNYLKENHNGLKQFAKALNGHTPLYEYTEVVTTPDYGTCFFIPYVGEVNGQVEGAIFFPIISSPEDGLSYKQLDLGLPIDVTPSFLNQFIEQEKRFIYGANFYYLKTDGLHVNQELTNFVDLINECILPLDTEVISLCGLATRAGTPMIQVKTYYATSTHSSISGNGISAITLAPETVLSIFKEVLLGTYFIPLQYLKLRHEYSCIIAEFPLRYLSEDPRYFIFDYHESLKFAFRTKYYSATLHSTYIASGSQSSSGNSASTSGGSSSGSATAGGTTGSLGENHSASAEKKSNAEIDSSLSSFEGDVLEFYNLFLAASKIKLGGNNYISFDDYIDSVKLKPGIEHGSSLIGYGELDGLTILTPPKKGNSHSVENDTSSERLIGEIHNHPNESPPSPMDLLFTTKMCSEKSNYKGTVVYNGSDILYSIYVRNKDSLKDIICEE